MMLFRLFSKRARWLWLRTILLVFALSGPVQAGAVSASPKVMVLPFSINASSGLEYLSTQIAALMAKQLERDGAAIVVAAEDGAQGISYGKGIFFMAHIFR